jgi:predicted NAD-dependent protein-ADP-ribosyltransferase YbiA (DUF1768 family)
LSTKVISYTRDAARVEVVLEEFPRIVVEADDGDAVWGVGMIDLPPLNEERVSPVATRTS